MKIRAAVSHGAGQKLSVETLDLKPPGPGEVLIEMSSTTLHYPERWAVFTDECRGIVEAITDRDVTRAGDLAEQQMVNARDYRVKLYSAAAGKLPDRYPTGRRGRA